MSDSPSPPQQEAIPFPMAANCALLSSRYRLWTAGSGALLLWGWSLSTTAWITSLAGCPTL